MVVQTEEEENFPLQSQHGVKVRNCDTHTHTHTHSPLTLLYATSTEAFSNFILFYQS